MTTKGRTNLEGKLTVLDLAIANQVEARVRPRHNDEVGETSAATDLIKRLADAIQERGRKAGSGEALFFDRFNLERVIREVIESCRDMTTS